MPGALLFALREAREARVDAREALRHRRLVAAVAVGADGEVLGDGQRAEHAPAGRDVSRAVRVALGDSARDACRPAVMADDRDDLAGRDLDHAVAPR